MATIKYLKSETAKVYTSSTSNKTMLEALCGDQVEIVNNTPTNKRYKVHVCWAKNLYIKAEDLSDEPLLELYFIYVGQGDGVLIVTPERKHILIDGRYRRSKQLHGKSAVVLTNETKTNIRYTHTASGALNPTDKVKTMSRLKLVDGFVYGLVNVRTDGEKILCATLNEGKSKWEIKTFTSRF